MKLNKKNILLITALLITGCVKETLGSYTAKKTIERIHRVKLDQEQTRMLREDMVTLQLACTLELLNAFFANDKTALELSKNKTQTELGQDMLFCAKIVQNELIKEIDKA